jgi:hypothetical protein
VKFEGPQIELSELRRQARFYFFADDLLLVPEAARLTGRKPLLYLSEQCALAGHRNPFRSLESSAGWCNGMNMAALNFSHQ